ncbi:peptidylprolyl isomerase, partial [candidate division KSB1 bacterium]|nr:peptidylprolyl isomerase [candidate division KSB1 bacterium]
MAVMNKMRENMSVILFFLLIMFLASMTIGGLVGGADILDIISGRKADTIMVVNGDDVSYEQFTRAYNAELEEFRTKNSDKEPQSYQIQQIENQVWDSFIRDILKRQEIERLGLRVSDEEIKYFIFTNPHPLFRMDQNFWNDKNEFDLEKFQSALNSPGNEQFWRYKEEYLRMYLPYEKLDDEIIATVRITDEEVREDFARKNQKVKVSYMFFDPNKYPIRDDEISEKEIKDYYQAHVDEFKQEEMRRINYVLFDTNPSAADTAEIYSLAEALIDSVKKGIDFATLAETYSDDPGSAANGGDLGFFGRNAMVKPFEEAAFGANVGDILGPIKSNFGFHIIKVEAKKLENKEEQVQARHILLKVKASRATQEAARDNANYFVENAKDNGFAQTATVEKVKVDTTGYFKNTGFIPKLGLQKRIATAAFFQKMEDASKLYYIEDKGYIVFQVSGIKKAGTQALTEVKENI